MILQDIKDFQIEEILECGQSFRHEKLGERHYLIVAHGCLLEVRQTTIGAQEQLELSCNEKQWSEIWSGYFDFDRDYAAIKERLIRKDNYLKQAILTYPGLRILRQEAFEMVMTFIISQNKQIPQIRILVGRLCEKYGKMIGTYNHKTYYAFPEPKALAQCTSEEFRQLKVGFRADYLADAVAKILEGSLNLEMLQILSYEMALEQLLKVKGIGQKVADCILLFAYGMETVFPTDVWVRRVITTYYFSEEPSIKKLLEFAKDYFGDDRGFAQQYLFYYARSHKVGLNVKLL